MKLFIFIIMLVGYGCAPGETVYIEPEETFQDYINTIQWDYDFDLTTPTWIKVAKVNLNIMEDMKLGKDSNTNKEQYSDINWDKIWDSENYNFEKVFKGINFKDYNLIQFKWNNFKTGCNTMIFYKDYNWNLNKDISGAWIPTCEYVTSEAEECLNDRTCGETEYILYQEEKKAYNRWIMALEKAYNDFFEFYKYYPNMFSSLYGNNLELFGTEDATGYLDYMDYVIYYDSYQNLLSYDINLNNVFTKIFPEKDEDWELFYLKMEKFLKENSPQDDSFKFIVPAPYEHEDGWDCTYLDVSFNNYQDPLIYNRIRIEMETNKE
jgi:hypothetical protein